MSLSLLGLLTEVMTMIGMENLYFTGTGYSISFARSSVCLDLSHFFVSFRFRKPLISVIALKTHAWKPYSEKYFCFAFP